MPRKKETDDSSSKKKVFKLDEAAKPKKKNAPRKPIIRKQTAGKHPPRRAIVNDKKREPKPPKIKKEKVEQESEEDIGPEQVPTTPKEYVLWSVCLKCKKRPVPLAFDTPKLESWLGITEVQSVVSMLLTQLDPEDWTTNAIVRRVKETNNELKNKKPNSSNYIAGMLHGLSQQKTGIALPPLDTDNSKDDRRKCLEIFTVDLSKCDDWAGDGDKFNMLELADMEAVTTPDYFEQEVVTSDDDGDLPAKKPQAERKRKAKSGEPKSHTKRLKSTESEIDKHIKAILELLGDASDPANVTLMKQYWQLLPRVAEIAKKSEEF